MARLVVVVVVVVDFDGDGDVEVVETLDESSIQRFGRAADTLAMLRFQRLDVVQRAIVCRALVYELVDDQDDLSETDGASRSTSPSPSKSTTTTTPVRDSP